MTVQCNVHQIEFNWVNTDDRNYCVWRFNLHEKKMKNTEKKMKKKYATTDIHMSVKIDNRLWISMKYQIWPWEQNSICSFSSIYLFCRLTSKANETVEVLVWISRYCHLWPLIRVNYVGGINSTNIQVIILLIGYWIRSIYSIFSWFAKRFLVLLLLLCILFHCEEVKIIFHFSTSMRTKQNYQV